MPPHFGFFDDNLYGYGLGAAYKRVAARPGD
jgi:hypothetical protein